MKTFLLIICLFLVINSTVAAGDLEDAQAGDTYIYSNGKATIHKGPLPLTNVTLYDGPTPPGAAKGNLRGKRCINLEESMKMFRAKGGSGYISNGRGSAMGGGVFGSGGTGVSGATGY